MNVYLKAAEICLAENEQSCLAIAAAERRGWPTAKAKRFAAMFRPSDAYSCDWLDDEFDTYSKQAQQWRLTALCFAAAMHDTGDL